MLARRHGVTALAHTWISSCVDLTSAVSPTAAKEQTFCKVSSVPVPGKCAAPETALRRPAPQIPPTLGAIPNAGVPYRRWTSTLNLKTVKCGTRERQVNDSADRRLCADRRLQDSRFGRPRRLNRLVVLA